MIWEDNLIGRQKTGVRILRASARLHAASRSVARRGAPSAPGACTRGGGMASRDAGTREHECGWLTTAMGCYSGRRLGKLVSRDRLVSWPSGGEENPTGRKVDQKTRPFPVSSSVWVKKSRVDSRWFSSSSSLTSPHHDAPNSHAPRRSPRKQRHASSSRPPRLVRTHLCTRRRASRSFTRAVVTVLRD